MFSMQRQANHGSRGRLELTRTLRPQLNTCSRVVRCSAADIEPRIDLKNGRVTSGPDLSVTVNGLYLPNPFVIGR